MTWLGKILTILIFVGALFWAYFTVQSHVLSTNWKVERDDYKNAYDEARNRRQDDSNRHAVAEDLLRRQVAVRADPERQPEQDDRDALGGREEGERRLHHACRTSSTRATSTR